MNRVINKIKQNRFLFHLFFLIFLLVPFLSFVAFLADSSIKSMYYYVYDIDEYLHVQAIYLISRGFEPYIDFFFNHAILFQWVMLPFAKIVGFSIEGLRHLRAIMIVIFFIRIFLSWILLKKLFNQWAALIFLPIIFFDPFTTFSGGQIRPDNLMLLWYCISLIFFILALEKKGTIFFFISGLFFGILFLIHQKSVFLILPIYVFFGLHFIIGKRFKLFISMIIGFVLMCLVFYIPYILNGSLFLVLQQTFTDAIALQNSVYNPFGSLYESNNAYIYGLGGQPLNWIYVWILLLMSAPGAYSIFVEKNNKSYSLNLLLKAMVIAFLLNFFSLFHVGGVYAQYYLPIHWFMTIFSAVFIFHMLSFAYKNGRIFFIISIAFFCCFIFLFGREIRKANLARATISYNFELDRFNKLWALIPENTAVYPNILFRDIGYPLIYGYGNDLNGYPQTIRKKQPALTKALISNRVANLIIDEIDFYNQLDNSFSQMLEQRYNPVKDSNLWILKEEYER